MFKTVLVAADSSVTAARGVSTAVELVKVLGGTLHVMTVYHPESVKVEKLPDEFMDTVTDPADLLLARLKESIAKEGVQATYHPAAGDAAEAIVRVRQTGSAPTSSWVGTGAREACAAAPRQCAQLCSTPRTAQY